jgi:hypothetical protein
MEFTLSHSEWNIIECAIPILQVFHDITNKISAQKSVHILETVLLTRFMLKHKAQFPEKLKP